MSLKGRRELLVVTGPRYQVAQKIEKGRILDQFVAATGYHRKYAIEILTDFAENGSKLPGRAGSNRNSRPRRYTREVQAALIVIWEAANQICSKRLAPFLPEIVEVLERHGHLKVSAEVKERLLTISPATVDRLLAAIRHERQSGSRAGSQRSSLLKQLVPIRTFAEWGEVQPGYLEADLVAHCGDNVSGSYLQTLTMTDVATGWTECLALLYRDQTTVLQAIRQAESQLPFALLGLDTDNGSEFLNAGLYEYCREKEIDFTRSRPYKKNDQCFVEQKNGAIVRQFIGYDRFEGVMACRILTELYQALRLYLNFFQPSLKLIEKRRQGSRVIKKYDRAQTPYQRVLVSESISAETKDQLQTQYAQLDPVQLLKQITVRQDQLWTYAYQKPPLVPEHSIPANRTDNSPTVSVNGTCLNSTNGATIELAGVETSGQTPPRTYRRSKRPRRPLTQPRWWRTRPDPFAEVWPEIAQQLQQQPHLAAKDLFQSLQAAYPGQFPDTQLRTFQRRIKTWRTDYATGRLDLADLPETHSVNGKNE